MSGMVGSERFAESSQGRIVQQLRGGDRTVEDLATNLELTGNAIRGHLLALERDGIVEQRGRRPGLRRPAIEYGLTSASEQHLSRAYVPVLQALVATLAERSTPAQLKTVLEEVGRRLALAAPRPAGDLGARAEAAAQILRDLGANISIERRAHSATVRGSACPLADVVAQHPAVCRSVQTLLEEVSGAAVEEVCDHGPRPACGFVLTSAKPARPEPK